MGGDITWGQTNITGMPLDQNVNKAEELTYLSTNIALNDDLESTLKDSCSL